VIDTYHDTETYSETPLKDGTHAYSEKAEIMLWTYALGEGPAECWDLTTKKPMPRDLVECLDNSDALVWFHNVMFDGTVMKHTMNELFTRLTASKRLRCSMVQAMAHGMPGGLDALCDILDIAAGDRKLKTGKGLIQLFCKPPAKNLNRPRATRLTHPVEWAQFIEYAKQDIPSMRAVHKKLPMWNYSGRELELWQLDQKINMRGVQVDVELATCAIDAVARAQSNLARRTVVLTDGEVARTTQRNKMLEHLLARYGVDLPDLKKSTIERRLDDPDLPWGLKELLKNRLQASSSSTSKYKTLVKGVSADGRLRGLLQFDGAQRTKRWAGRLFQPQNLTRPCVGDLHDEELQAEIMFGIEAIKANCEDLIYE